MTTKYRIQNEHEDQVNRQHKASKLREAEEIVLDVQTSAQLAHAACFTISDGKLGLLNKASYHVARVEDKTAYKMAMYSPQSRPQL